MPSDSSRSSERSCSDPSRDHRRSQRLMSGVVAASRRVTTLPSVLAKRHTAPRRPTPRLRTSLYCVRRAQGPTQPRVPTVKLIIRIACLLVRPSSASQSTRGPPSSSRQRVVFSALTGQGIIRSGPARPRAGMAGHTNHVTSWLAGRRVISGTTTFFTGQGTAIVTPSRGS